MCYIIYINFIYIEQKQEQKYILQSYKLLCKLLSDILTDHKKNNKQNIW